MFRIPSGVMVWKDATEEYSRLLEAYPALDYEVSILPKAGVTERADYVLRTLQT